MSRNPRQDLQDAINLLANLTEAFTAALFLYRPDGVTLQAEVWHTFSRAFRSTEPIAMGEGLVGYVAKHNRTIDVDRYQQASTATGLYEKDEGIKAFLAVPMPGMGVLVVDTKKRQVFGELEKKTIAEFAAFLSHLIRHQETRRRERLYGRSLDLLYDIENASLHYSGGKRFYSDILKIGCNFTGLDMGLICLLHPGCKQYTIEAVEGPSLSTLRGRSFPVSQGLVGWIMREAKPLSHCRIRPLDGKSFLVAPDESLKSYNSVIGVPLLAWRKLSGVLLFAGASERDIDKEEENVLRLAGHRVAATIEHYRLAS